jgi:phage baseplate assembly protein W
MSIGLTLPLARSTGTLGYLASTTTEIDATEVDLKSLVLTNWGERPNRFNFGCNLVEFLFENQTRELQDAIVERISGEVANWLPWVKLKKIDVLFPDDSPSDPSAIGITIRWSMKHSRTDSERKLDVVVQAAA